MQERRAAGRDAYLPCQARTSLASEHHSDMLRHPPALEGGSSTSGSQVRKLFGKDPPGTGTIGTKEAANTHLQHHRNAAPWEIMQRAKIRTLWSSCQPPAQRTWGGATTGY